MDQGQSLKISLHDRVAGWILDHRREFISAIALLLVGIMIWGGWHYHDQLGAAKKLDQIYAFQEKNAEELASGALSPADFLTRYQQLRQEVGSFSGLYPFALAMADELMAKNANQEALTILEDAQKYYVRGDAYRRYFVGSRLAVAYENLGQNQKAIDVLQTLDAARTKLLADKVKLDLGRLYRTIDPAKAKTYLKAVADSSALAELSRIAKLYLNQMDTDAPVPAPAQ
jgi:tetratricopeptide (TPR) repeat protein